MMRIQPSANANRTVKRPCSYCHRLRIVITSLAVLTLFTAALGLAQEIGDEVPKGWVKADTLRVTDFNFSIDSPVVDWRWTYKHLPQIQNRTPTAFFLSSPDGRERYTLGVLEQRSTDLGQPDLADVFIRGMVKSLPTGWSQGRVQFDRTDVPVPHSAHFTTELHSPDGNTMFLHGYLLPGQRTYELMTFSSQATEPETFSRFARSFRFVDASQNQNNPQSSGGRPPTKEENLRAVQGATQLIGLLLLVWFIVYRVRRARRR